MKLGIMQPYFFPYLGYWQLLNAVDKYIVLDDVTFIKGGFINKNNILLNAKPLQINVQVNGISSNKLIVDHQINSSLTWKNKLFKSLKQTYLKSPEFSSVIQLLESCIFYDDTNYLTNQIKQICSYLSIDTEIVQSSQGISFNDKKGQDRILSICQEEKARSYINAVGGQELYQKEKFKAFDIELSFLKTNDIVYPQFAHEFVPYLSIIDVLMFNSIEEVRVLLHEYNLV